MYKVRDLTNGEPAKLIFIMALPLLAGNIVSQLYGFVDTLVVGRFLGVEAMAAVGCAGFATAFIAVTFGTAIALMMNVQADLIRALGNTEIPTKVWSATLLMNAVFDVIAIVIFDCGIIGCVMFFVYTEKQIPLLHSAFNGEYFTLDEDFVLEHLKLGLPVGFQGAIIAIGGVILQVAINQLGSSEVAAVTAGQRIEGLTLMFFLTFAQVISSFAAQNYGAERYERIIDGVKKCAAITVAVSLAITAFNIIFGADILNILLKDSHSHVIEQGTFYIVVNGLFYWVFGLIAVFRMALQGLGKNKVPMLSSSIELVVKLLVALFLIDQLGFMGICLASPLAFVYSCLPLTVAVLRERKKIRELLGEDEDKTEPEIATLALSK